MMKAIYKREMQAFFHSFTGWLFLAITLFLMGQNFMSYNIMYGAPTISYVLQSVLFLFIFTIPVLTMRIFAEDRKYKTDQLILTAPVSVVKIVMAKYLALVTILAIPTILIGLTPLALQQAGEFQMGLSYAALLGFFLYGCLALAVGLYCSARTESVVISAVVTLAVLFCGYIMSGVNNIILGETSAAFFEYVTSVLNIFDMVTPFDRLSAGYFEINAVLYYITFIVFLLFATVHYINRRVRGVRNKVGRFAVLIAAVVTIALNGAVAQIPERYTTFDMTSNKLFSLTEDTKEMVKAIGQDVTIYVLVDESMKDENLDVTLQQAASLSEHVTVQYVDTAANPKFYYNYTETKPEDNSLIVVSGDNSVVVDFFDIYDYRYDYYTGSYMTAGYDGEGQLASALQGVLVKDRPKFYTVAGHGELEFDSAFLDVFAKENVVCETLSLYAVESVPEDARGIILNAPINDYSQEDVDKIKAYLEQGGNALIVLASDTSLPNFEQIPAYYGVSPVGGMIVEQDAGYYYFEQPYYLIPNVYSDEITEKIDGFAIFAPFSSGLVYDEASEDVHYVPLLGSSDSAFSRMDFEKKDDYAQAEGDIEGPFVIALKAERASLKGADTKAVIVANESMFTANADAMFPGNNVKLFAGVISQMAERESSVTVPVKSYDANYLSFSEQTANLLSAIAVIVPLGCLVFGITVWFLRRKK